MKCSKIKKNLPAFVSNDLQEKYISEINLHLQKCTICTTELETIKSTISCFKLWNEQEISSNFESNLNEKIAKAQISELRKPVLNYDTFNRLVNIQIPLESCIALMLLIFVLLLPKMPNHKFLNNELAFSFTILDTIKIICLLASLAFFFFPQVTYAFNKWLDGLLWSDKWAEKDPKKAGLVFLAISIFLIITRFIAMASK